CPRACSGAECAQGAAEIALPLPDRNHRACAKSRTINLPFRSFLRRSPITCSAIWCTSLLIDWSGGVGVEGPVRVGWSEPVRKAACDALTHWGDDRSSHQAEPLPCAHDLDLLDHKV